MGLFLAIGGVIRASSSDVRRALKDYALSHGGGLELKDGTTDDPDIGIITESALNTSILYPNGFNDWDEASKYISKVLQKPVFSFHIHDGDFWMYVLFNNGYEVGRFNSVPEYWGKMDAEEKKKWIGDADLVASLVPGITSDSIRRYLIEWSISQVSQENIERAYPDDEFMYGDCWQMVDFMGKIGLKYPMGSKGEIYGETIKFWTEEIKSTSPNSVKESIPLNKPWWKFW